MNKIILQFLILSIFTYTSLTHATYVTSNGEVEIEFNSQNTQDLKKESLLLKKRFTQKYFDKWFLKKLNTSFDNLFVEEMFSLWQKEKMIDRLALNLLGTKSDIAQEEICHQNNEVCHLFKEVGHVRGTMMLYIHHEYGVNTTHLKYEQYEFTSMYNGTQEVFTVEELLSIIVALELFGHNLKYIANEKMTMTFSTYDKKVLGNALIYFFSEWRDEPFHEKVVTVLHEMYHNLAHGFRKGEAEGIALEYSDEWSDLFENNINKDTGEYQSCFISYYATRNTSEDAAETLLAFFHNREALEKVCPQKSLLIKKLLRENTLILDSKTTQLKMSLSKNVNYFFKTIFYKMGLNE